MSEPYYEPYIICPRCGRECVKPMVALSRRDNKTAICPHCGTQEALEDWIEDYEYDGPQYWEGAGDEEVRIATNGETDTK